MATPRRSLTSLVALALASLANVTALTLAACSPAPAPRPGPPVDVAALFPQPASTSAPSSAPASPSPTAPPASPAAPASSAAPTSPCQNDLDCGYDPTRRTCGADPRLNKQPPLVDQGIVCYCDTATNACGTLRVDPVPCEGDTSCAVLLDPRPHPVRASAAHPYVKPTACRPPPAASPRDMRHHVTCERTNICTLHTRECAR